MFARDFFSNKLYFEIKISLGGGGSCFFFKFRHQFNWQHGLVTVKWFIVCHIFKTVKTAARTLNILNCLSVLSHG
jgi:hypothetical protein